MNKISKKIVALATMAAFVLTLVPAAAFAANEGTGSGDVSYKASGIVTSATDVKAGDQIEATLLVEDSTGAGTDKPLTTDAEKVKIWAVDSKNPGELTDAVDFTTDNENIVATIGNENVYKFTKGTSVENNTDFYLTFKRPGTYTIYMGVGEFSGTTTGNKLDGMFDENFQQLGETLTVTVGEADVTTSYIDFKNDLHGNMGTVNAENPTATLNLIDKAIAGDFQFNGTDPYTIYGVAHEKDGSVAAYDTFNVSSSKDAILKITSGATVTTENDGSFSITFTMSETQNGYIYIENDDVEYAIRVVGQKSVATDIKTVKDGGYVMAGTDDHWDANSAEYRIFSDAVQFEITDAKGNVLTGPEAIENEPAHGWNSNNTYLNITEQPTKSTLLPEDLQLVWANGVYTLQYVDASEDAEKDLIPGKYTVSVALDSDRSAEASFYVAEYGKTQNVTLDLKALDYTKVKDEPTNWYTITDEVTLGQKVAATVKYVDENGLKIPATNTQIGIKGDNKLFDAINAAEGRFNIVKDTLANEALLGSVITVQVFDANEKTLIEQDLTLVDSYSEYSLAFDPTEGEVNTDNKVTVSVVDEDGNVARVTGALNAFVADQSNKDAKVSLDCSTAKDAVKNGKGTLNIYADKETTVDIVVAVDTVNGPIYAGTLEYTVGAEDLYADRSVVMTIGSTDYVVNNNIIEGDAAPYIDSAWRTMVPFRVLGESFGATVDWDQDAQSVTYVVGDTELVMTIGEETYTINGEEFNMDTAPVLSGDRTYVPVRFVAEGLGFTVTPLYDAETGLTASVVFQK